MGIKEAERQADSNMSRALQVPVTSDTTPWKRSQRLSRDFRKYMDCSPPSTRRTRTQPPREPESHEAEIARVKSEPSNSRYPVSNCGGIVARKSALGGLGISEQIVTTPESTINIPIPLCFVHVFICRPGDRSSRTDYKIPV